MARPPTRLTLQYSTTGDVARALKIWGEDDQSKRSRIKDWIDRGILPSPTLIDSEGTRYFDDDWIKAAQAIIQRMNKEISFEQLLETLEEVKIEHSFNLQEESIDGRNETEA
ncbi:MAG: hypothetical protein AMJ88_13630 [Anaerolineae bacterium SM23_ 63]|nr:MAG: hypothetical protein AMJ88_13630 [Anaerolineae bacterium SM23_ 63]